MSAEIYDTARRLTRRDAARAAGGAALAAAGARLAPSSAIRGVRADGDPVVFGLIGAGSRGQHLLRRLNGVGTGICSAVCDSDGAARGRGVQISKDRPRACADHRELLDRKDVEAVLIATPLYTHFPIVKHALEAGKHVFCENLLVFKPEEIVAFKELAAAREGQVLQTGLQRRYSQFYQTAKQMVSKGMLGEVTEIHAQWNRNPGWTMIPEVPRERNWRLFREFSGGIAAEMASHQMDVANWMFVDVPEFVSGVGGLDWRRDGRDICDNIALILKYSAGRKMTCSYVSMAKHLPFFGGARKELGEVIMGTEGSIEITIGTDESSPLGVWFYEADAAKLTKSEDQEEMAKVVGATVANSTRSARGFPILFAKDQISGAEKFIERELKYARRWLYSKNIMVPEEERNPVDAQLAGFFESCRGGKEPRAGMDAGLEAAAAAMAANLAVDEGRRVRFEEIEQLGRKSAGPAKI